MTDITPLLNRLKSCPKGRSGWREFEDICIEILTYLFVPPLTKPKIQPRTYSGIDRRDAVFPNRNMRTNNNWGYLYQEFGARMILVEFKNYGSAEIGKGEVNQTRNYMTAPMGRLSIICCNKKPNESAHIKRNTIFSHDQKLILFLTKQDLREMLFIKERREDPSDLIVDKIEWFYLQHE